MNARHVRVRLLALSAIGLYAVAALGTTDAVTRAEAACTRWPTCTGSVLPPTAGPALLAWGHRASVFVVGLLLLAAAVATLLDRPSRRVWLSLAVALVAYVVEVAIGRALVAGAALSGVHLAVAAVILAGVFASLTWTLEPAGEDSPNRAGPGAPLPAPRATSESATDADASGRVGLRARLGAYAELTKPRLMWLLSLVALAGMTLAAGGLPPLDLAVPTVVGGALSIGASGAFNHVLERDRDAAMDRTSDRPVVTHQVPARRALAFGVVLAALAMATFVGLVNATAAAIDLGAIAFYTVGYTMVLKPNTSWNITLGGAVGAFPALVGSAAIRGTVGAPALLLGLVVFTWTPAHFYNLALAYEDDYRAGGFPMLPVVAGRAETRRHILGYLGVTFVSTLVLAAVTHLDLAFVAITAAFGAAFLWAVVRLAAERTDAAAFRAFHASNAYLGALLVAVLVSGVV